MQTNEFRPAGLRAGMLAAGSLFALIAIAGCGGHGATAPVKPIPLTLQAVPVGGAAQRFASTALAAPSATDTIPVTFTQALLVIRDVRFVLQGDDEGDDTDTLGVAEDTLGVDEDGDDDGGQVRFRGPYVVDLLAGTAQSLDTEMVPPGAYDRVQGHLRALRDSDAPSATYPSLVGATIRLEGTIGGEGGGPFVYEARIDNEFMIRGDFTLQAETPATAFLVFDLSRFLTDRNGHFLDPRVADNDLWIKQAIRHAIKIGMDDDHDGQADDDLSESAD